MMLGSMPTVHAVLARFSGQTFFWLLGGFLTLSFVPLPVGYWLGNGGEPLFAPLAPLLLVIVTGLVWIVWWLIAGSLQIFGRILRLLGVRSGERALRRHALLSLGLVCLLIFLLIPWQVAFLGCWIYHFYSCAVGVARSLERASDTTPPPRTPSPSNSPSRSRSAPVSIPLTQHKFDNVDSHDDTSPTPPPLDPRQTLTNAHRQDVHFLFLMTWLLPFAAPVLAVWVRTVATAGATTPFDGDHNFLRVAPFLVLAEVGGAAAGRGSGSEIVRKKS